MSDRAKIRNRRVSGNDVQQQRDVANAIKVAREMALLPYAKRVANQRTSRPPRDGRPSRADETTLDTVGLADIGADVVTDDVLDDGDSYDADIAGDEDGG